MNISLILRGLGVPTLEVISGEWSVELLLCAIVFYIFVFVFALIPARIGERKGYSFAVFYVFGLFAFLPALITALVVKKRPPSKDENSDETDRVEQ